ncbi:autophagy-related protein 2 homolog B isoform X2 [Phymastichus coffea]|nr:autophagy-related protein 2 homolog B isoform X2 [Phymastichus coffea]
MGPLTVFLSPRQVHALMELMEGLASPDMEDVSNVVPRHHCSDKPMLKSDFNKVERELLNQINPAQDFKTMDLRNTQGWSTASLDNSDNDEQFYPMCTSGVSSMNNSVNSNNTSMEDSFSACSINFKSSIASSATKLHKSHRHRSASTDDQLSDETSQFHLEISSLVIVLLHEDILTSGIEGYGLTKVSVTAMRTMVEDFFKNLGIIAANGFSNKNFEMASEIVIKSCQLSHLRLLATPLAIEANEKTTGQRSAMSGQLSLPTLEIVECLFDSPTGPDTTAHDATIINLLSFTSESIRATNGSSKGSDFQMKFSHTEKAMRHGQTTKYCHPFTEFEITLGPCQGELDISIIDRISSLLNRQPVCVSVLSIPVSSSLGVGPRNSLSQQSVFYQAVESPSLSETRTEIKVSVSKCLINLRFPIPDLRPAHEIGRTAWWRRSVRKDYASLELLDAKLHIHVDSQARHLSRHELQSRQVLLTYTEVDSDVALEIGKANADEGNAEGFGWPRIVLTIYPLQLGQGPLEDSSEGEIELETTAAAATTAANEEHSFEQPIRHQPSPFSSKRVIHESDTPHPKHAGESRMPPPQPHPTNTEDKESGEFVLPGNRQEMTEFIEEATQSARVQLELGLPCVSLQIPSKHLYELIYNRFNTDLLLWQPSAPKPSYPAAAASCRRIATMSRGVESNGLSCSLLLQEPFIYPKFSMCRSGVHYESNSDTDDDYLDTDADMQRRGPADSLFYSASANPSSKRSKQRVRGKRVQRLQQQQHQQQHGQSKLAVSLSIGQGLLTMYSPVRDSERKVIPGQQGKIMLRVDDALVFSVSEYKSDENLGYVCAMAKEVVLHHCSSKTAVSTQPPPLRSVNSSIPKHCVRTIYRTEPSARIVHDEPKDMLAIALSIQTSHDTHRVKTYKVAVSLSQASLNHRVTNSQTSWFSQLSDCLDVIDHPVAGYTPPSILTELHAHLWDCAIDYRPLHLPLSSFVTLGNFSVSSNIAAQTNTSTLRFIAEDLALFISSKVQPQSQLQVDLRKDYVCVMDMGLFELSLRLNDRQCGGAPRVDLRASSNILHIRTCSDSGRALMQLLTYFAADGDLDPKYREHALSPEVDDFADSDHKHHLLHHHQQQSDETLLPDESISLLSKSQVERVNSLMEEAMEESAHGLCSAHSESHKKSSQKGKQEQQVEVFFFPDEQSKTDRGGKAESSTGAGASQEKEHLRHHQEDEAGAVAASVSDDTDDDFCILGEEAGVGIIPAHGVPEVRWLSHESVKIIDNHFAVPASKRDLLKPPKNFPNAVMRYRLREATLVWHMYGGKDFAESQYQWPSCTKVRHVVYFENDPDKRQEATYKTLPDPSSKRSWQELGGPGRRLDVLMELQLNKVRFLHEIYPEHTTQASWQGLEVNEIEVRDRLASSQINMFLYQYSSEARPKQSFANMLFVKAIHTRPDPRLPAEECCLKISLLPVRLNIDQDSLLFLVDFFSELQQPASASSASQQQQRASPSRNREKSQACDTGGSATSVAQSSVGDVKSANSRQGIPIHQLPVMSVNYENNEPDGAYGGYRNYAGSQRDEPAANDRNLMILLEDELTIKENKSSAKVVREIQSNGQPVYFRSVIFSPDVFVRLDYHGKRVDLTHGPLAGLLMGLAQLNCSELRLKRLVHRQGLLGYEKLVSFLLTEWIQDIKKNQLPSLLGGVGPMYSLVQLFQGVRDLFWLPIEQYQKDGRIVRGLQRGANSFTTSTAMAALELTSRLVNAIQSTAETAYDMVSPGPSVRTLSGRGHRGRRKRYTQPLDIREGVTNAYVLVKEGLGETASQLIRVASEEHEQKGVSGAVGGVLRQIPPTVVKPIILATEATNNVLGGMRSQLVPDARREAVQKWRSDSDNES